MIDFTCTQCGKRYSVQDAFAGRSARCRICQTPLRVPELPASAARIVMEPIAIAAPREAAPKLPPRTRRLLADATQLRRALESSSLIVLRSAVGDPPESYQIEYRIRGLARGAGGQPVLQEHHLLEIQLTRDYPRQSPKCRMLTPIFHPNFDPTAVCVGDHWVASERLIDLVIRIGEMIAYQAYNVKSPLDGEAAMWADLNQRQLPIDSRDLRPPNLE
jgi:ubiquitin-protein ligase